MGPDSSLTPELIQAQSFTTAFRGYDSAEVKSFLNRVSKELRAWRERAEQLESAWHSAEERAARPPVLDEDTLMSAVGEETAAILRTARAAAAEMRTKAAEEAERSISEARSAADQTLGEAREEAERTVRDAKGEADRVLTEARAEAARLQSEAETAMISATKAAEEAAAKLLSSARDDASETLAKANAEAEEVRAAAEKERQLTIEGANTTRDRILEDLGRRRRVATVQIEQLRAGRERLIESYAVVRRTLEEVQSELSRADAEARAAADDVGRRLHKEAEVHLSDPRPADRVDVLAGADSAPSTEPAGSTTIVETGSEAQGERTGEEREEEPGDGSGRVDELFARIRADRGPGSEAADAPTEAIPAVEAGPDVETGSAPEADRGPEGSAEPAPAEPEPAPAEPDAPLSGAERSVASTGEAPSTRKTRRRGTRTERATTTNGHARPAPGPAPKGPRSSVTVIEAGPEAPVEASGEPAPESSPGGGAGREPASKEGAREGAAPDSSAPEHDGEADGEGQADVLDRDESLLQAREFAVVELETTLTRRLKRALQDEQNDLLDRLRNLKGVPSARRLLPDPAVQTARYSDGARPLLGEAATAGAVFADEALGLPGRDAPVEVDVADLALECGSSIVEALRRRLEQAIDSAAGEDQAVLVESVGAAYREWKTQRIERLAGDVLSAAFARGTWRAAPDDAWFRWVVDDADGPCPDCDDDALAGTIPKAEAFPTGQHHPPAHSGCRCLLVPGPAGS